MPTASAAAWASEGSILRLVSCSATDPSVPMEKGWTSSFGVDDLAGALRWLLLGALTWAIDPAAETNWKAEKASAAANRVGTIRHWRARWSRGVLNAIGLSP